ncbi:DUF3810 domain-containing protein [Croceitalea vernalis]|uniref:DUF3810 domain-containing protein n=1 Tax=Croceitalea vernalis TaxID=3075599 RepID=A0ABU3BKP4_9FLAO|nr:DUF3810 domain-containing protein [Croceitalea sp. P007]MDT0622736.1 DUF3810 domain-containing protein [Croceitalea sp. P007]
MKYYKKLLAISIVPQIIFVKWFGSYPDLVEKYYSEGLYPFISKFLRILFGWIPFSIGDLFYTLLVLSVFRYFYLFGKSIRKTPKQFLQHLGLFLSIAYFIFHLFWGMNYYRLPINEKMNFKIEYSKEELVEFTLKMVKYTNLSQNYLTNDTITAVQIPYSTKDIYIKTLESYSRASTIFPFFEYQTPSLKSSLYSTPLTYMGYGGYLNPFTNEAQVNAIAPKLRLPSISGHEVGHQIGYSSESATNFIGMLVTFSNKDLYFKYASLSHILAYCLSDLKNRDEEAFQIIFAQLSPGVKNNYQELNDFWAQYENPTEPIFKSVFNTFLKANNQERGIESYNAVVGLLVNFDSDFWYTYFWQDLNLQN